MAHKTFINGTAYEVEGGKCLVSGTGYDIESGKTLVGGTAYDISFGIRIGDLAVGDSVFLNVSGVGREFIVVNQGIPQGSSLYDASCDGTWLLMKDCHTKQQYDDNRVHDGGTNDYENTTIHTYLNGTFLGVFDADVQSAIKQVKIPYRKGTGSGGTTQVGTNGLSTKVFLLSWYEVGRTDGSPVDGGRLSYFESGTDTSANQKRICYYNGSAARWWLRSPTTSDAHRARIVDNDGGLGLNSVYVSYGIRPALILPPDFKVKNYL